MRWNPKKKQRVNIYDWHPYFAWFPVKLDYGTGQKVWLERIERKKLLSTPFGSIWVYR